jgi:hypothetical protein
MSAEHHTHEETSSVADLAYRRPDMERLRARRRQAERRRRLARLDVGIGVGAALFLFIVSPGLAITGIVALLTLLACGLSVVYERRRARRGAPSEGRLRRLERRLPGASGASTGARRAAKRGAAGRPRSTPR